VLLYGLYHERLYGMAAACLFHTTLRHYFVTAVDVFISYVTTHEPICAQMNERINSFETRLCAKTDFYIFVPSDRFGGLGSRGVARRTNNRKVGFDAC